MSPARHTVKSLMRTGILAEALAAIQRNEPDTLDVQAQLCETPAPPFGEGERAAAMKRSFADLGLAEVRTDDIGNVIAVRRGCLARPSLVLSAHLDSVFPVGTDVRVRRKGNVLAAPGIYDDCRGLAVLLAVARVLQQLTIETSDTLIFVATVGEEGEGDLRGVRHLCQESLDGQIDRFISIDGVGNELNHIGIGSRRYRMEFFGPGGHSFRNFGNANPAFALGDCLTRWSKVKVSKNGRTTFNIGRIGGGIGINMIPSEVWFEIDLRSTSEKTLKVLEHVLDESSLQALHRENSRCRNHGVISLQKKLIGSRPCGATPASDPLVQCALEASMALDLPLELKQGSTDANVPMGMGIPAISISGGGSGKGSHTLAEEFDCTDSWKGSQRVLLLTLMLAMSER